MIDAHVHIWDPLSLPYDWLAGVGLDRPMSAQLHAEVSQSWGQIFVEASVADADGVAEVEWVAKQPWLNLLGIVARIDLDDPQSVAPTLAAYQKYRDTQHAPPASTAPIVGVRHLLQHLPHIGHYSAGIAEVLSAGLSFDVCITHEQLVETHELLSQALRLAGTEGACGNLIIDHLAKPDVDAGLTSASGKAWQAGMATLAALPNAFLKLSGLVPESRSAEAFAQHAASFVAAGLELFGPQRCLFASDWPVSSQSHDQYQQWVQLVRDVCGDDWEQVSSKTALTAYRVSLP